MRRSRRAIGAALIGLAATTIACLAFATVAFATVAFARANRVQIIAPADAHAGKTYDIRITGFAGIKEQLVYFVDTFGVPKTCELTPITESALAGPPAIQAVHRSFSARTRQVDFTKLRETDRVCAYLVSLKTDEVLARASDTIQIHQSHGGRRAG
jgi:hypothetical protein